jgi:uncharacterized protein (DUF885 family)
LADEYFDRVFLPLNPTHATTVGIHDYDDRIEDYSRAGMARQIAALRDFERRIVAVDDKSLSETAAGDRALLLSDIRSTLLTLETIKPWENNPDTYSSGITTSAFAIMERAFAPPGVRLRALIAREQQMPAVLDAAHANLRNPARIFTQIALEQLPGIIDFFQKDLPAAFADVDDAMLQAQFAGANARVLQALHDYAVWLEHDVLPRSHGDFRLGSRAFRAKLLYDEMVDTPLPRLRSLGMEDLRRNQHQLERLAHVLEPDKTPRQVLAELATDHPAPDRLLDTFRATFDGLVGFINARHIITLPSLARPVLRETPPFERATTFASMDTPGPFESVAKEAYFNVTLPAADWSRDRVEGFMAQFNYAVINSIAIHEAYPGHYVQFLWLHDMHDRARALLGAASNTEGWAHYCEQMMLDEGYGEPGTGARDARQSQLLRLGQLQDALLRDARFLVGISMHAGRMSYAQAIDFFVNEGYQSRTVGEVEAKRGSSDPTYLYYTLGKLQIFKLRADLMAREGSAFTLESFHRRFMQQGFPPLKIVRRALLHDDSPTL